MSFNILPIYKQGINEIENGLLVWTPEFCEKNCYKNNKCLEYYKNIILKEGIYTCPYGFNSYVFKNNLDSMEIFTGLRIKNQYDKKKIDPKIKKQENNKHGRIIDEKDIIEAIELYNKYEDGINKYDNYKRFVENIIHDIRKFNSDIKHKNSQICVKTESNGKIKNIYDMARNISSTCSLMTLRLNAYDFTYNDGLIGHSEKINYNLFKIFDKSRLCLNDKCKDHRVKIDLKSDGECGNIKADDSIELIPYIILDNAVKYSKDNTNIYVNIEDNVEHSNVKITSISLKLEQNEKEKIFNNGFRGNNAKNLTDDGLGIGLYTAKKICNCNSGKIYVHTEDINDDKYCKFIVDISFNK